MEAKKEDSFEVLKENVGKFNIAKGKILIPEMNRNAARLFASAFRGFGIHAQAMETYKGLDLGQEFTSGKECYPCQVTMGDILHFLNEEKKRLGDRFDPGEYVYFLPESDGPCRYGMYNKYQRIVLDSFPELGKLRIFSLTTTDGYSLGGMLDDGQVLAFKKVGYFSMLVADILDRILWRIRPYEREAGMADVFLERSRQELEDTFEAHARTKCFDRILDKLEEIIKEGKRIMDPDIPRKPIIGIVGEIFLRMHTQSNQDLIKVLETHGAEVVNASLCEWINYVSYEGLRVAKKEFRLNLKLLRFGQMRTRLKKILSFGIDLHYKESRQKQVYKRVKSLIDIADDHKVSHLEDVIKKSGIYSFDIGTEACLSIASILEFARGGYNGVVNVYPFTCMPGVTTSAIVKPMMGKRGIPYLDTPYDASVQPGREAAIRTFMYQASQHFKKNGREHSSVH